MKKYIIAAATLLATMLGTATAAEYSHSVLINLKEGGSVAYKFEDVPVATIDGDNLKITLAMTDESVIYPFANVVNLTFEKKESGIANVKDNASVTFGITSESLEVWGLTASTQVSIFDATGALRATGAADEAGYVTIETSNLDKGVYLVKAGAHSFKFIR